MARSFDLKSSVPGLRPLSVRCTVPPWFVGGELSVESHGE